MELIYSEEWRKKNEDRKDFVYTPKCKNLMDVMNLPEFDSSIEAKNLFIKVLDNYIYETE